MWTEEFEKDPSLGIMTECYENLKAKGRRCHHHIKERPLLIKDKIKDTDSRNLMNPRRHRSMMKYADGKKKSYSVY